MALRAYLRGRWLVSFREQTGPTPKARCDANDPLRA